MYQEYYDAIDRERLLEHVRRITEIAPQRLSGSEEERKIVAYFKEVLEKDKIPVTVHEIDAYVSFPQESKLELLSPGIEDDPLQHLGPDPIDSHRKESRGRWCMPAREPSGLRRPGCAGENCICRVFPGSSPPGKSKDRHPEGGHRRRFK